MHRFPLALALTVVATAAPAYEAGLQSVEFPMPHHDAPARVAIWYPGTGGTATPYAASPIFQGIDASLDAEPAPGTHPVVMFSHGMGGTDRAQAWLGAGLARRGAMVVMVNHPNSTWGDFDMSKGVRHWTRAQDITVALDNLLEDPSFGPLVDPSRIMAAGFSYGGWTALSLGGMTGNLAGLVDACTVHRDRMEACEMLMSDGVGLQQQDPQAWNTDFSDARITSVVAIDPGFVWGLEAGNTASLLPNAVLISLGDDETRMMATDFDESGLTGLLPDTRAVRLAPAFHFTAMPLCTETGPDILAEENDDPVCTDPDGTDRKAVHDEIVGIIAGMLGL